MYRSTKTEAAFRRDLTQNPPSIDDSSCPFCDLDDRNVYVEAKYSRIVDNAFPYEFWDKHQVVEHLLLLPKRHVVSLSDLEDAEKTEVINLMAEYETKGYSVYWRSETNKTRTLAHQHTHLFKVNDKEPRLLVYLRRPYLFWVLWRFGRNS